MVRNYEIAFLIKEGDIAKSVVERIKEALGKSKATVTGENDMGNRALAYVIRKNRQDFHRAFYYFVKTQADTTSIPEFERLIKFDEDIIRYMILVEE